jgi:hypothetical protein
VNDAAEADGRVHRRLWWATAGLFFVLAATYALATPLTAVPDEAAHVIRAVAVVDGQFTSSYHEVHVGAGFTKPVTRVRVPRGYAELDATLACLGFDSATPASCGRPIGSAGPDVRGETYVGAYPPTYYLLVGWPSHLFGPRVALYAMRLLSAAIGAALMASAIRALLEAAGPDGRPSWALAGVVLAATPIAVFLVGGVNPSGLEVAAACCWWASALALLGGRAAVDPGAARPSTRAAIRFAASGVLLIGTRPLSPFLAAAAVVVVGIAAASAPRLRTMVRSRRAVGAVGIVGAATVAAIAFGLSVHAATAVITSPPGASKGRGWYARQAAGRTWTWLDQLVGRLGWVDVPLWRFVAIAWGVLVVALAAVAVLAGTARQRLALVATGVGVLALPVAAEVVSGPTVGMAWQGRYGLPLAVGIPILSAWILLRRPDPALVRRVGAAPLVAAGVAIVALCHLAALVRLLDRYAVGLPSRPLAAFSAPGGPGPLGWRPLGWLAVVVCVLVGAGWAVVGRWIGGSSGAHDGDGQVAAPH